MTDTANASQCPMMNGAAQRYMMRRISSVWLVALVLGCSSSNQPTADGGQPVAHNQDSRTAGPPGENTETISKCPVVGATTDATRRHTAAGDYSIRDWWPNQLNLEMLHQNSPKSNPMGADFNYAEEFKKLDLDALKKDIERVDDDFPGLVASRLRQLWAVVHSDGLAQRRYVSSYRRTRWRRLRHTTFCATQQLARQREPRQSPQVALADQAKVR